MSDVVYFIFCFFVSLVFGLESADSILFGKYTKFTIAIWSIMNAYFYYNLSEIFGIESDYEKRLFITELTKSYFNSLFLNISVAGLLTYFILTNHILLQSTDIDILLYFHLNIS